MFHPKVVGIRVQLVFVEGMGRVVGGLDTWGTTSGEGEIAKLGTPLGGISTTPYRSENNVRNTCVGHFAAL